jgi:RNA polymerase sigma factor (TIGR02999 family)
MDEVYDELRALAGRVLRQERKDHTLQATAVVHEAYMRLMQQNCLGAVTREQFYALAALMIRRVLVDHARRRRARRDAEAEVEQIGAGGADGVMEAFDLLAFESALEHLEARDARKAQVVHLRFFSGLTVGAVADVLGLSPRTVAHEWAFARAWLKREMSDAGR